MTTKLTVLAMALTAGVSVAQVPITYTGSQANVDPKQTSLPTVADSVGWRNTTPAKPLDVDGDDIIGTDGYTGRTSNAAPNVIPSYLTYNQMIGGGNPFGYMDNPLDPTGIDTAKVGFQGGGASNDLFSITVVGTDLRKKILGLVVQFDTYNGGTQTYTLEQRAGGVGGSVTSSATSGVITNVNDGYDWAFFEIQGPDDGDVFVLRSVKGTAGYITFGEVAFDTEPIPPSGTLITIR